MSFITSHLGEFFALGTAIFWTITALANESASMKVGSMVVNIIRLSIAFLFLSAFSLFTRGIPFPTDATPDNWLWLILSGLVGFVFGDLFLFKSFTIIGSRNAMLVMSIVPPMAAFFGWLILNEELNIIGFTGMFITLIGIAIAIVSRKESKKGLSIKLSPKGLLFAFGGALGQALGLVLSKLGTQDYNAFAATQIRIIAGVFGFALLITIFKRWATVYKGLQNAPAMKGITIGSFFGPFLGVSFSLLAIVNTTTGIASTIMSIIPILIIAPSVILFKQKASVSEIIGAIISVIGVAIFFIF